MDKKELEKKLSQYEEKLKKLKEVYHTSIEMYSRYGEYINSKTLKDCGVHLVSLSLEMQSVETSIELIEQLIDGEIPLDIKIENCKNIKFAI